MLNLILLKFYSDPAPIFWIPLAIDAYHIYNNGNITKKMPRIKLPEPNKIKHIFKRFH